MPSDPEEKKLEDLPTVGRLMKEYGINPDENWEEASSVQQVNFAYALGYDAGKLDWGDWTEETLGEWEHDDRDKDPEAVKEAFMMGWRDSSE